MQEKCPVCGKIISANENRCSECGFTQLHKTFISKIDAEEWIAKVIKPYKIKYEESKINSNIQTLQIYNGTYTGEVLNGKRHGYGKFVSNSGMVYEGEYKDGLSDGKGKKTYENGDVYEGEWKHGRKHGYGKMIYADGCIYEGEFLNNYIHGKGKKRYSNGDMYEGQFSYDKKHGRGKYTWSNGMKYEGNYIDDKRHGYGEMRYADGTTYKGQWENGKQKPYNQQTSPKQTSNQQYDISSIVGSIFLFFLSLLTIACFSSIDSGFSGGFVIILAMIIAIGCIGRIILEITK